MPTRLRRRELRLREFIGSRRLTTVILEAAMGGAGARHAVCMKLRIFCNMTRSGAAVNDCGATMGCGCCTLLKTLPTILTTPSSNRDWRTSRITYNAHRLGVQS
jgi:hypothetical protein